MQGWSQLAFLVQQLQPISIIYSTPTKYQSTVQLKC